MSSHEGSPFDQFQWERDDFQTDLERERQCQERQRQGGQQLALSKCLELGTEFPVGTSPLQTPTLSPAGVGRGGPMTPLPQSMDFSASVQMEEAPMPDAGPEGNTILGHMFPPPVKQPPLTPLLVTPLPTPGKLNTLITCD